jgi:hypothetical protein
MAFGILGGYAGLNKKDVRDRLFGGGGARCSWSFAGGLPIAIEACGKKITGKEPQAADAVLDRPLEFCARRDPEITDGPKTPEPMGRLMI